MFKFNINRKASKEAAAKKAALKTDLKKLMQLANEQFTVHTAIKHRKKLYCEIQKIRNTYTPSQLPSPISQGGWTVDVNDLYYSYLDNEGMWHHIHEAEMQQWENNPSEIGPYITDTVTPLGSFMYHHQGWCKKVSSGIKKYLTTL